MIKIKTLLSFLVKIGLFSALLGILTLVGGYYYLKPGLPDVEQLRDIQLQIPLRVYSADRKLIAEFGEKRRTPITYNETPELFKAAILAAEDSRFYEHPGVDIKGLARAAFELVSTGKIQTGGSTITMQVAKNYFLTRERTFTRKFNEILLALQIEQELSKPEILELYVNKIYLGHRAYGIQAAANVYYGRDIDQLTIAELAMIAGLPKAPSSYNPLSNPERAMQRRNWILSRMLFLGSVTQSEYELAVSAPVTARYHGSDIQLRAPYIAEMVRSEMVSQYGEVAYTDGFTVYTSIQSVDQEAANQAVVDGLIEYEKRHGYRGPEQQISGEVTLDELIDKLKRIPAYGGMQPAIVVALAGQQATVLLADGSQTTLAWEGMSWARPYKSVNSMGPAPQVASDVLTVGDLIRVVLRPEGLELTQIPQAQAAFVALSPQDGAIRALVGGFSFSYNKFNRVTQGTRQPGSNFKPFVYTAALANGFTPATLINDAPVVFEDDNLESSWRPENYSKKFYGPTRLREALYKSRNLVSIRILRRLGISGTLDFIERFGFDRSRLPNNLSLALGSADVTPLELVTGYATFANQGFKVEPYFIQEITAYDGATLFEARPRTVCEGCVYVPERAVDEVVGVDESAAERMPAAAEQGDNVTYNELAPRILDEQTAYLINNIMRDVITRGTGRKAKRLQRNDLAGKTGTTNDQKDAWFSGFNQHVVASAWVGFDQPSTLGRNEFGSTAALPIWIDYMEQALTGVPELPLKAPADIVSVRIDPKTGLLAYPGQEDAIFEVFRREQVPQTVTITTEPDDPDMPTVTTEELF